ncbi:Spore germination protein gerPA/gerPF [Desulfofundulus australicus DSM 11792]|uniref:Spore germination protein gerPA/gerPF n=1 Tax=Desulfofundulus australicus DSM 11792 TaxID=1121425 RepID=A0A1M5CN00_9FIRM|nr:spore germination protein [Desulfofundulus australicus]SHF56090.1 Spore germination protein gerPA/gerPF [Desulfofundulus australicus DSM 11792]
MPLIIGTFKINQIQAGGTFNLGEINISAPKNSADISADQGSFNVGDLNIAIINRYDLSARAVGDLNLEPEFIR